MGERITVSHSDNFQRKLKNFPKTDQLKIRRFIEHLENFGFEGLIGRNKSSDNVPTNHPNWLERVKYAQQHKLWHYLRMEVAKYYFAHSQDKGYA